MSKQYGERDASELDEAGGHYIRHVMAMTSEGLYSKSDIAAELGFRDMQIADLYVQRDQLREALQDLMDWTVKHCEAPDCVPYNMAHRLLRSIFNAEADHLPDVGNVVPDGWQLVPVDPTIPNCMFELRI